MALTTQRIGASQQYPWGHQVYVDFLDDETGRLQHESIVTATALSAEALDIAVEGLRVTTQGWMDMAAQRAPEVTMESLRAEVVVLKAEVAVLVEERAVLVAELGVLKPAPIVEEIL